jgi:hypothetical protein
MKTTLPFSCLLVASVGLLSLASGASLSFARANAAAVLTDRTSFVRDVFPAHYTWALDPSPNFDETSNILQAVSAASPNDVWAVGNSSVTNSGGRNLIEHWNGGAWNIVDSPNMGSGSNDLMGIAALSHNDAWAAGAYYNGPNQFTLIEHWDGSAWSIVPSPNPSPNVGGNSLMGMSAAEPHDIWAVGAYDTGGGALDETMALRWNGTDWQIVPTPNNVGFNALFSVSARSSTDAWAVGASAPDWTLQNAQPVVMHWDGNSWNMVSVPVPEGSTDAFLLTVGMGSHDNIWAVGSYRAADGIYHTFALHSDGQQWTIMPDYTVSGAAYAELRSVAVAKTGEVWAIGWGSPTSPPPIFNGPPEAYPGAQTLILRWGSGGWTRADSPEPGVGSELMGLTAFPNRAWAVGNFINSGNGPTRTLVAHYGPHVASAEARAVVPR